MTDELSQTPDPGSGKILQDGIGQENGPSHTHLGLGEEGPRGDGQQPVEAA